MQGQEVTRSMATYFDVATIVAFISLLLGGLKLWWDQHKARADSKMLQEGIAALYKVVEGNGKIVEALLAQSGRNAFVDQQRIELEKSRLALDKLKLFGHAFKYIQGKE